MAPDPEAQIDIPDSRPNPMEPGVGEVPEGSPISPISPNSSEYKPRVELRRLTSVAGLPLLRADTFNRIASIREERSKSVASHLSLREGVHVFYFGDIIWQDAKQKAWDWIKQPLNFALFIWAAVVAISGALFVMIMIGMLDAVLPSKTDRNTWGEICNQILNAMFTLMCLFLQPDRIRQAVRLQTWTPADILVMRTLYCKGGRRKKDEWKHMLIVVILLNLNGLFQYGLAAFNWGFRRESRPAIGVAICLAGAIGCGAAAGIYASLSPLGKDSLTGAMLEDDDVEGEAAQAWARRKNHFEHERIGAEKPEWQGEVVVDYCSNFRIGFLSSIGCICVFGINQERLGFGNRYVHIITFALFLGAPILVLGMSAIDIDNFVTRRTIFGIGLAVSILGLFYGGYWRMKMRQVYNLPPYTWCFRNGIASDMITWLFCSFCALSQEVRTAEFYEVFDGKLYHREREGVPLAAVGPDLSIVDERKEVEMEEGTLGDEEDVGKVQPLEPPGEEKMGSH
eukprot:TRINITY_DN2196_c1_g4_i1.p1 TRINITY_DN2196_c1_g4~~TRINITY_DN2196_c1_g4_i1.p1  ORF type:complete len:511 (+),score=72.28 TRINITY_DN2196_c1_g4_i1:387-1919(+)